MSINEDKKSPRHECSERIAALRQAIRTSFPAVTYTSKVTRHDGEWLPELTEENAILEDDKILYDSLYGRKWTDISNQVLHDIPDGLPLLTDEAFVAFVAAWLTESLERMGGNNEIRDFVVYTFSPKPDMVPDMTGFVAARIRLLNPEQKNVVRSLLAEFATGDSSAFVRRLASKAVALIDSISGGIAPAGDQS